MASILSVLSFVSPQVSSIGRGLRTTLPCLAIAALSIAKVCPSAFPRALARFRAAITAALVFMVQAGARFMFIDDSGDLWHRYVVGPTLAIVLLIMVAALSELGQPVIERYRQWLLLAWGASLGLGLPILVAFPGVARTTMGNEHAAENAAQWAPLGVGEYGIYTGFAICVPILFATTQRWAGWRRWVGLAATFFGASAVILSTFSMAVALMACGAAAVAFAWIVVAQGRVRLFRAAALASAIALLLPLFVLVEKSEQAEFVFNKLTGLASGISSHGLERGDETERGAWFVEDLRVFGAEPFLGYIPDVSGQRGHGHSSVADSLVLFGMFGAAAWFVVMALLLRDALAYAPTRMARVSVLIGWSLLALSGILNPSWHSPELFGAILACGIATRGTRSPVRRGYSIDAVALTDRSPSG